jgi:hypothetical protein
MTELPDTVSLRGTKLVYSDKPTQIEPPPLSFAEQQAAEKKRVAKATADTPKPIDMPGNHFYGFSPQSEKIPDLSHLSPITSTTPMKFIFDTDLGSDVDDALALLTLLHLPTQDVDVLGIITTYGHVKLRSAVAAAILASTGRRSTVRIHATTTTTATTNIKPDGKKEDSKSTPTTTTITTTTTTTSVTAATSSTSTIPTPIIDGVSVPFFTPLHPVWHTGTYVPDVTFASTTPACVSSHLLLHAVYYTVARIGR